MDWLRGAATPLAVEPAGGRPECWSALGTLAWDGRLFDSGECSRLVLADHLWPVRPTCNGMAGSHGLGLRQYQERRRGSAHALCLHGKLDALRSHALAHQ